MKTILEKQTPDGLQKRMSQEAEELLYYIKQRLFFRFGDFLKKHLILLP